MAKYENNIQKWRTFLYGSYNQLEKYQRDNPIYDSNNNKIKNTVHAHFKRLISIFEKQFLLISIEDELEKCIFTMGRQAFFLSNL